MINNAGKEFDSRGQEITDRDSSSLLDASEFSILTDFLRKSIKDFDLFEELYFYGVSRATLARKLGISERMLGKRLKRVKAELRKAIMQLLG